MGTDSAARVPTDPNILRTCSLWAAAEQPSCQRALVVPADSLVPGCGGA